VPIIDSGIDGNHPDLRANFNRRLSRNFTTDIPLIDGPCEHPSCVDPVDEDDNGHGTHVAGLVAAGLNGLGTAGVAPRVTLVNIRGGRTPASYSSSRWSTRSSTPAWWASTSST
jgi:lantibiotic leader peptide-processing serine protease